MHAKVRACGLEVRGFAFRELVDVQRVFAWRKILNIELDLDSVRRLGKCGGANALAFGVFDVDGDWLRGWAVGCGGCHNEQKTHAGCDRFDHFPLPFAWISGSSTLRNAMGGRNVVS